MTSHDRRTFLVRSAKAFGGVAFLSATGVLTACGDDDDTSSGGGNGGDGGELATVASQFNWIPDIEWAAWYLADSNGFFADHGVRAVLNHGGPNTPSPIQVLAGGDSQIGLTSTEYEIVTANNTGADYIALGAMYQRGPLGFAWLEETGISGPEDLAGLRIGAPQGRQPTIDAVFRINDLDVDYEYVPMSFDPQPLVDGEVDVITAYVTNQPVQLELRGIATTAMSLSDFGLKSYGDLIFAERSYVEENRDAVVGYLAGLVLGAQANRDDPEAVIPLLVDEYGADAEINEEYSRVGNPRYIALMGSDFTEANGLLSIDPEFLEQEVWPGYVAAGQEDLPDPADFVDTSLLAEAHDRL